MKLTLGVGVEGKGVKLAPFDLVGTAPAEIGSKARLNNRINIRENTFFFTLLPSGFWLPKLGLATFPWPRLASLSLRTFIIVKDD